MEHLKEVREPGADPFSPLQHRRRVHLGALPWLETLVVVGDIATDPAKHTPRLASVTIQSIGMGKSAKLRCLFDVGLIGFDQALGELVHRGVGHVWHR